MKINKLVEEITNFDNLKDPKTVIDAVTGDAIETSKEAQDNFDKVAKPFEKPILGKKEDEKSPAQDLDEGFSTDGWELENDNLLEILDEIGRVKYEIDNCVRGSYTTHADTYTELARYLIELANDLIDAANDLADGEVSEDDGWDKREVESSGDMDEALKKSFDFSNGDLRDFDPADLMDKVKKRQMSLFSSREFGNKLYDISIHPHGRVDDLKDIWVDIVSEDLDGNQERIFLKKFLTYDDAINAMNEWKKSMIDSAPAVVEESMKSINESDDVSDIYMYSISPYDGEELYRVWKKGPEAVKIANDEGFLVRGDFGIVNILSLPEEVEELYGFNPDKYTQFEEISVPRKTAGTSDLSEYDYYMYKVQDGYRNSTWLVFKKDPEAVLYSKLHNNPVIGDFGMVEGCYSPKAVERKYGFNPNDYKELEEIKVPKKSVDESLINEDDGRQRRVNLTPEQRAEEKAMAETLFDRVYNELEKATNGSKNKVNKKASQRYNSEDISTDVNGNIIVYAKDKESLTNAVNVARAYQLKYKIEPGSIRNKAHAFQCVLYIPEE